MADDSSSSPLPPVHEENTANSLNDSEDQQSIKSDDDKSPAFKNDLDENDSEVERSDNEESDDENVDDDSASNAASTKNDANETNDDHQQLDESMNSVESKGENASEHNESAPEDVDEEKGADQPVDEDMDDEEEIIQKQKKKKEADNIFGDSDSEDEDYKLIGTKRKQLSDSSGEEEDEEENEVVKKRKRAAVFGDSDDEDSDSVASKKVSNKEGDDDDDEEEDKKSESDQNDDENKLNVEKNDQQEEANDDKDSKAILPDISSDSDDDSDDGKSGKKRTEDFVYDFDLMMAKKKEQNARNRRRKNTDLINDSDDFIADLISQMKQAAEEDFELNKERKAATRKMQLLNKVQTYLRKIDLRESFLDSGVLSVMTDWLTPLPDRSLPNLQVREIMLKILIELNIMDVERLKSSSIGKAVMYLFKHPKETKENKRLAAKLISNWSRPIFNSETDYQSISKEEREHRDYANMSKARRMSSEPFNSQPTASTINQPVVKPGEKGWVPRARVPAPSTRDYVVRPKSTVEFEMTRSSKKPISRLDKHLRNFQEKKRNSKMQRAVKISIEGRKL